MCIAGEVVSVIGICFAAHTYPRPVCRIGCLLSFIGFCGFLVGMVSLLIGRLPWEWRQWLRDEQEYSQRNLFHSGESVTQQYGLSGSVQVVKTVCPADQSSSHRARPHLPPKSCRKRLFRRTFCFRERGASALRTGARPVRWVALPDGAGERSFAQIYFRKCAPDHNFGNVLYVAGNYDFLLKLVADERFGLEFVDQVNVAVGIHKLPVWVWRIGDDEVVRQRQDALAIACAVGDMSFICLRTLELGGGVHILSEGGGGE